MILLPFKIAAVTAAAVPSIRSRGFPPVTWPMNDFRDAPVTIGLPRTFNSPRCRINRKLSVSRLSETQPGIHHDPYRFNAICSRLVDAIL